MAKKSRPHKEHQQAPARTKKRHGNPRRPDHPENKKIKADQIEHGQPVPVQFRTQRPQRRGR